MRPKRITCFISSLASGGAEHQLAILANMLCEKGYKVDFVTCLNDPDYYMLNPEIRRIKINTNNSNFISTVKMIKFFRKHDTDVIISFRERMNLTTIVGCLGRKIKIIAGERSFTIGRPTIVGELLHDFFYKYATYIVPNSSSQEYYLRSLKKNWANKLHTITNYTDINLYQYCPPPIDSSRILIGVFARFSPHKNCLNFVKMLNVLRNEVNIDFEIHWYGQNTGKFDKEYYQKVLDLISFYKLENKLFLHNAVKDVANTMKSFHAIALPSIFEGFSNSIAEGICCGKPMLVSKVSDNGIMVKDGENGFLFDPNDIQNMVMAFKKFLILNSDERNLMGVKSRQIASELFDAESFVSSYIELIER